MNNYPFKLEEIVSWLRSKDELLHEYGVTLAEIHERTTHVPAAAADFDSANAPGRISFWVTGEVDFEVLRISEAKAIYFHHESLTDLHSPLLESALEQVLEQMASLTGTAPG